MSAGGYGLILGGAMGLKELLSHEQEDDAKYKAAAYRASPYIHINPEAMAVHKSNPVGAAVEGGLAGAEFGQDMQKADDEHETSLGWRNYLNTHSGLPPQGVPNVDSDSYWGKDSPTSSLHGLSALFPTEGAPAHKSRLSLGNTDLAGSMASEPYNAAPTGAGGPRALSDAQPKSEWERLNPQSEDSPYVKAFKMRGYT